MLDVKEKRIDSRTRGAKRGQVKRKRQFQYSSPLTTTDKVLRQFGNMLIQPTVAPHLRGFLTERNNKRDLKTEIKKNQK